MDDRTAIVIFGAAVRPDGTPSPVLRGRVEAALRFAVGLVAQGAPPPLFVPTGGVGRHGPSEASVMARALRRAGVADEAILMEERAANTLSSARAVATLLRARGHAGPVVACSSGFHLPRCRMLLRLAGLPAHPCPPPPATRAVLRRWHGRLREVAAIPVDLVLMLGLRLLGRLPRPPAPAPPAPR